VWQLPNRRTALWFCVRASVHIVRRAFENFADPRVKRFAQSNELTNAPIIAESRSPLWTDGRNEEFDLVTGKVENLRRARHAFDGIVLPANSMLSFWQQLGRTSRLRGFVEGREIRSGCVVPTRGGGICQLTHALATCAHQARMHFVERHTHTARIQNQSTSETSQLIDATVFWNYVDLRFQTAFDIRIEVEITADELIVRFRAAQSINTVQKLRHKTAQILLKSAAADTSSPPMARGCMTCAETECFRHRGMAPLRTNDKTAVLLNAWTPEFAAYLNQTAAHADWYAPWLRKKRRTAGSWIQSNRQTKTTARLAAIGKTLLLRKQTGEGGGRQSAVMQGDDWIASALAAKIKPHHTHLVIDQTLLVRLAKFGALDGRHYDVLVHSLLATELQARLDRATEYQPDAASLVDFRANHTYGEIETHALLRARTLITPHVAVADHLKNIGAKSIHIMPWQVPTVVMRIREQAKNQTPVVVFPASALARKGACELAHAMRELDWQLWVLGAAPSDPTLWRDVSVKHVGYHNREWLSVADVVALPAYIEHSPRTLLQAFAHGIPIVATAACGLPASMCASIVREGDANDLIAALKVVVMRSRENCDKISRDVFAEMSKKEAA
jgi:glycosyltransferase involved in cell wall biosynthesis